jgi:hypothetical protein
MENQAMLDLLWRVLFRWQLHPQYIAGDTTYGTIDNIVAVEREGDSRLCPAPRLRAAQQVLPQVSLHVRRRAGPLPLPFGRGAASLQLFALRSDDQVPGPKKICNACPLKERCTPGRSGRKVEHGFDEAYVARVRAYRETEDYKKAIRKRKVWIEPLFGEAKQWHGLRQFRLRGLDRVNMEGLLIAAGRNIKRLLQAKGWGRRPWPAGDLLNVRTGSVRGDIAR